MGMRNHNEKAANSAVCLPSFLAGNNAIQNAGGERIAKYLTRQLERDFVLGVIPPVLFLVPFES
jgi:hypothetical protein